jgi:hypothetical protein
MGGDDIAPNHHFHNFKILLYQIITQKIITFNFFGIVNIIETHKILSTNLIYYINILNPNIHL